MSPRPPDAVGDPPPAWRQVDEGWGRLAVDFATLSEPANCREYVALHHHLGVAPGDRLLDMACGAGLAVELATILGAVCSGIDASPRLIAVARDRTPHADLRVGDMQQLPWPDASFDVVTSFRGIWGTTPDAVAEAHRVLAPGGRIGITVWGHIKRSQGAWALAPLALANAPKVEHQAAMVTLGRPGAGEDLLSRSGFVDVERHEIPFVWEFADPDAYARAIASLGPAYEAIVDIGEEQFVRSAIAAARERVRDGLPLRASIAAVGYVARKPTATPLGDVTPWPAASFLDDAPQSLGAAAAVRQRPARARLRHERHQALGARSGVARRVVRAARTCHRGRVADLPSTRRSSSPHVPQRSATRTAPWPGGRSWPARPAPRSPSASCAATTRRSTAQSGRSPAGPASSLAIRTRRRPPTSRCCAPPASPTRRSSPRPSSWRSASRSPRSTTRSAPSPISNSAPPHRPRSATPSRSADRSPRPAAITGHLLTAIRHRERRERASRRAAP